MFDSNDTKYLNVKGWEKIFLFILFNICLLDKLGKVASGDLMFIMSFVFDF